MTTSKIQMDQIRSTSATDTGENIRAGSQKKSSLSPAEGLQGASPDATCTCPSGNGSLRHPCPAHPASVEQAGGDERTAFEAWMTWLIDHVYGRLPDFTLDDGSGAHYVNADVSYAWTAWQARAALAQPSPAPAEAEQHWPKLEKPAQVGGGRFSAGVSSRLVVEAAQRLYEFESTPEKEAERIERLQAFREQCFEPLGTEFSKVLSDNLPELLSTAQAEHAEAEAQRLDWPSALLDVAVLHEALTSRDSDERMKNMDAGEVIRRAFGKLKEIRAQHERIVGALRTKADQLREALEWRKENQAGQRELLRSVTAERDAALARVAELEKQEPVAHLRASDLERLNQPGIAGSAGSLWNGPREGFVPLYAAPVAQAQHSVPELLVRAEDFVSGFEDDDEQEGVSQLLADLRLAIGRVK
ncbi:hypothetical protein IPC215_30420 [Pseudomonas aeruginosa]|uniref:hypothetical protein n=1 Tax=Pseudomonas aeruginosa TaxID=287 RepID=UPI000F54693B|nr:hypothetical protein [Pseudomonas aeruginosa]RQG01189.1 hypothetical protein IPC215_30420 [Pseudomonas aeruginosa]